MELGDKGLGKLLTTSPFETWLAILETSMLPGWTCVTSAHVDTYKDGGSEATISRLAIGMRSAFTMIAKGTYHLLPILLLPP